jgi:hypothetical protein
MTHMTKRDAISSAMSVAEDISAVDSIRCIWRPSWPLRCVNCSPR